MKWLAGMGLWIKNRFDNVYVDKYPWYWHLFDLIVGFAIALAFTLVYTGPAVGIRVAIFFGVWILGYLLAFAFTYGPVRARNGWTKKRK